MTLVHIDIFSCFSCGELASLPHGSEPPLCCGAPMVKIVSNILRKESGREPTSSARQHPPRDGE